MTVGIHTHNDGGVAIANALAAVRAGADHAQGTINGVGERCGNMDLIPLIANLQLKYKLDCLRPGTLQQLTEASRYVYETANYNLVTGQPYVGSSAFAHKGGMHVHAVQKDASTYEHVSPETVGNTRKILISEMSGVSNIATKAGQEVRHRKRQGDAAQGAGQGAGPGERRLPVRGRRGAASSCCCARRSAGIRRSSTSIITAWSC